MGETCVDSATQTCDLGPEFDFDTTEELDSSSFSCANGSSPRVVIDTSPPFGSVEEAVIRFGGRGFWIPRDILRSSANAADELDARKLEEQAGQMLKDLNLKEQETLTLLKELELTKKAIEQLKLKLFHTKQQPPPPPESNIHVPTQSIIPETNTTTTKEHAKNGTTDDEESPKLASSSPTGVVMVELKQARLNLSQSRSELASIRATVESLNRKMEEEKSSSSSSCCYTSSEQTCSSSSSSRRRQSLEHNNNLNPHHQVQEKVMINNRNPGDNKNSKVGISRELRELNFEAEQFMRTAEAAKAEVLKAMSDIERTKTGLKMIEMRWVAAKKMEEAAKAAEELALAEIKALSVGNKECCDDCSSQTMQDKRMISLSLEEYTRLAEKARRAEEDVVVGLGSSRSELGPVVGGVEDENTRKMMGLEEFMGRVQVAANRRRFGSAEVTRRFGGDPAARISNYNYNHHHHNRHPAEVTNSSYSSQNHHNPNTRVIHDADEMNGQQQRTRPIDPRVRPTSTSIGDILSRKLVLRDDLDDLGEEEEDQGERQSVSLNQMLRDHRAEPTQGSDEIDDDMETTAGRKSGGGGGVHHSTGKHFFSKRLKNLGFVHVSLPLSKQSKSKIQALHPW